MRGTFALLITLLISLTVKADENYCQSFKEVLSACDQGACGGIEIQDEIITKGDNSFEPSVQLNGLEGSQMSFSESDPIKVTSNLDSFKANQPSSSGKELTQTMKRELGQSISLNIPAEREDFGVNKKIPTFSYGIKRVECNKLSTPDYDQINDFLNITRKVRMCSVNTFLALKDIGRVDKFCNNKIKPKHVYKTLCEADCSRDDISQKDKLDAQKQLVSEAKSVILKMYQNRIFDTLNQLSMIPHKGNFYDDLPKECTVAATFLDPNSKKQIENEYKEIVIKHQNILAEEKEQNECFPNGVIKHYFQYSQGNFQYLDTKNGSPEVRSVDFSNQANVYKKFSSLFDDCSQRDCRESFINRKASVIDKEYDNVKKRAAEECSILQKKLSDLSKPENFQIALNPQILNIRNNYNEISFGKTNHRESFTKRCLNRFSLTSKGPEEDNPTEAQCLAIKNLMCQGKEVDPKVVEETSGSKTEIFEGFAENTYGAKRFRDTHVTIAKKMCDFIKDQYERSPEKGTKDLKYFSIDFLKSETLMQDLKFNLANDSETSKFFGGDESIESFLRKFGEFNNITKLSYLDHMYEKNKQKAACSLARNLMGMETGNKCNNIEGDGVKNIISGVKNRTVERLKVLSDKGFTGYDTSLSDEQNQSLKFEDEPTPSRSIASVDREAREPQSNQTVSTPQTVMNIPLSQQIQGDIDRAQNELNVLEQKKTEVDSKVMRTLTNFTPDTPEAKAVIQEQKETNEEIEKLRDDISRFKREKEQALAEERDTKLNREFEQTKQNLQAQGLSIAEVQDIPLARTQKIAEQLGENNYYANSVKQGVSDKPEIEIIYPISASEYQEITSNPKLKPISMTIDEFDPVTITNKYLTDVERELGGSGSIVIDQEGRHLILVTDKSKQDKIYYQLRVLEMDDGRKLVKGVFLPVSKKPELRSAIKNVSKRVLDKVNNIPLVQDSVKEALKGKMKKDFAATYVELLKVLEDSK